jgi:Fur family zinc uptake transcriptional regulator
MQMNKYLQILKDSGSKITKPRKKILQIILDMKKPFTVSEVHRHCEGIDFASVYRTIKLFHSIGIVKLLDMTNKTYHYEISGGKHVQKIICTECGRTKEIDLKVLKQIERSTEFILTDHSIIFQGTCVDCQ